MPIISVTIPRVSDFAVPAIGLATAAAGGSAKTVIRSDANLLAFDATLPADVIPGTAQVGSATTTARRDHIHSGLNEVAFSYVLSATDSNVTGAGTLYTLGSSGNVLTRVFDQTAATTTAGLFTAAVAGIYLLGASIRVTNTSVLAAMDNYRINIVTTLNTLGTVGDLYNQRANTASLGICEVFFVSLFKMAATNTATVTFQVFDSTDTIDLETSNTTFWGLKVA
jgi:hypothetical protein